MVSLPSPAAMVEEPPGLLSPAAMLSLPLPPAMLSFEPPMTLSLPLPSVILSPSPPVTTSLPSPAVTVLLPALASMT
jgi:hypothetical protein